ncbi:MAG TPA: chemotaxis protein [Xanthobacteraceae bacterium]|nr:chemotaxis protein [Xanthobacteraceae bacterium]
MPVRQKTYRIERETPGGEPRSAVSAYAAPGGAISVLQHQEVLNELRALRDLIEQRTPAAPPGADSESESAPRDHKSDQITVGDLNKLKSETDSIHRAIRRTMQELASLHFGAFDADRGRASRELDAVVDSTERATQQILDAAESIDEAADTLSAALKQEQERALASDIRDQVVRIFEACNFQDLSGQRIAKVLATLTFVEDRVARMLEIWGGRAALEDYAAAANGEPNVESKLASGPKLDGDSGHVSQQEIDAMFA